MTYEKRQHLILINEKFVLTNFEFWRVLHIGDLRSRQSYMYVSGKYLIGRV